MLWTTPKNGNPTSHLGIPGPFRRADIHTHAFWSSATFRLSGFFVCDLSGLSDERLEILANAI